MIVKAITDKVPAMDKTQVAIKVESRCNNLANQGLKGNNSGVVVDKVKMKRAIMVVAMVMVTLKVTIKVIKVSKMVKSKITTVHKTTKPVVRTNTMKQTIQISASQTSNN